MIIKAIITFICFLLLVICYWAFNDPTIFWRVRHIKPGAIEFICWILCVAALASFVIILWLN